jgi:hypothetical protein
MMHDDLLDIAARLAQLDEGKPRQTSLRRAISSAYYALFHALARLCANHLVGWSKPWEVYSPIYRTMDHGRAKEAFRRISSTRGRHIAFIGETFILLQERRHWADYDPSPFRIGQAKTLGRDETRDLIEQARQAITQIESLSAEDSLFLAAQLIARTRP